MSYEEVLPPVDSHISFFGLLYDAAESSGNNPAAFTVHNNIA
jgi:hypothetical protein